MTNDLPARPEAAQAFNFEKQLIERAANQAALFV
jgi:hypothetical protein